MNQVDAEYFRLLNLVTTKGRIKTNRTGVDTIGTFGAQARFDLQDGFPILTTKKVFFKSIVHELLWFIKGSTNIKYLVDNDVHIWDDWAYDKYKKSSIPSVNDTTTQGFDSSFSKSEFIETIKRNDIFAKKWGELGEGTYGGMWRDFPFFTESNKDGSLTTCGVDQIKKVIEKLKTNPDDRRLIVSAWHPYWVDQCALPPCHILFQFHTELLTDDERENIATEEQKSLASMVAIDAYDKEGTYFKELTELGVPTRKLNCQLYQRSCDLFIGIPFNIASYSLLTHMVAHVTHMVPGEFIHTYGDLHVYTNHLEQVKLQLTREPYKNLPILKLNPDIKDLFEFKYEDIKLEGYEHHQYIKADIAV